MKPRKRYIPFCLIVAVAQALVKPLPSTSTNRRRTTAEHSRYDAADRTVSSSSPTINRLYTATDDRILVSFQLEDLPNKKKPDQEFTLELDDKGNLVRGGTAAPLPLIESLDRTIWSSSRPSSSSSRRNSLFLHTTHPTERAEHRTSLGNLTPYRLLACSRLGKTSPDSSSISFCMVTDMWRSRLGIYDVWMLLTKS